MCDYSVHAVATRPAEVAETLVSTKFKSTTTRGFASPGNPQVAVCLRPGTELAFENDVQAGGFLFRKKIGDRLARFRQVALDQPSRHHDALEFSMVQSFWSPISQLDNGPRCCNCLQAQWMKRLRRPDPRLDMRLLISDGLFAMPTYLAPHGLARLGSKAGGCWANRPTLKIRECCLSGNDGR